MNILFKYNNEIPYGDLDIGDVFEHDGRIYMMTDQKEEDSPEEYKSVDLANGEMEIFGSKVMVRTYEEASLTLK